MVDLRPQPIAWSEFAQSDEPPIEKLRGWPLITVYAGVLGFCIAVWWGVYQCVRFIATGEV